MHKNKISILLFLFVLATNCLHATNLDFVHYTSDNGLSQNTVMDITQDSRGVMWFATHNGLNSFDGYDFRVFHHEATDSCSISSDLLRCLLTDSAGNIWAGGDNGLSMYDAGRNCFRNYLHGEDVFDVAEVGSGWFFVTGNRGLTSLHPESGTSSVLQELPAQSLATWRDIVFIGTSGAGVIRYDKSTEEFSKLAGSPEKVIIQAMLVKDSTLWMATEGNGLYSYALESGRINHFTSKSDNGPLCSDRIRTIAYADGDLWIGTVNGLDIMKEDGAVQHLESDPFVPEALSHNSIRSIYHDNQGGLWLGTWFGGVNYWHPLFGRFRAIVRTPGSNSLVDNIINCLSEDPDGLVWIGTNGGGLNCYNISNRRISSFPIMHDIKAIVSEDGGSRVFVGSHAGGLTILDKANGKFFQCPGSETLNIYSILKAPDGKNLLLGALEGLFTYAPNSGKLTGLTEKNGFPLDQIKIKQLLADSAGRLWAGGEKGLVILQYNDGVLCEDPEARAWGLNLPRVEYLFESSVGTIWIGTRDGLFSVSREGSLKHFGISDGFLSNVIHAIEEDASGKLWISTDAGISCFNPFSAAIRNYTSADGIRSCQFNRNSSLRLSDGEIWFGGVGGITAFKPDAMQDNPYSPAPIITSCLISKSSVTLRYAVPNFISGRNNSFCYKLEGFDREWFYPGDGRSATYSRIPPGKYIFKLRAANNDGLWSEETAEYPLEITPEWWQTIWFRLLVVLLVLCLVVFLTKAIVRYNRIKDFIRVAQEMSTPLSLILTPLEEMLSRAGDVWMRKQIKYVERNTRNLLELSGIVREYNREKLEAFSAKARKEYEEARLEEELDAGDSSGKKGLILLLGEDREMLGYLSDALSAEFGIELIDNAESALDYVKNNEVSLIIADVKAGKMGGIRFCGKIKTDSDTSHLPVILISSNSGGADQIAALKAGADDYMGKPFSMAALNAKIRNIMRTRVRLQEKVAATREVDPAKITFNAADEQMLRKALKIVEANLDNQDFSAEIFASEMGMSRSNLHIKLKAITGESALEFIHKVRFSKACELIRDGRYSIAEISDMVGFNTPAYFSTCFKKQFGCLPSAYVKMHPND